MSSPKEKRVVNTSVVHPTDCVCLDCLKWVNNSYLTLINSIDGLPWISTWLVDEAKKEVESWFFKDGLYEWAYSDKLDKMRERVRRRKQDKQADNGDLISFTVITGLITLAFWFVFLHHSFGVNTFMVCVYLTLVLVRIEKLRNGSTN